MRVGLAGSPASADLGVLKREIEDRGHKAVIFNLRKFPQYSFGSIASSGAGATLAYDHRDLLDFDSLYIGDLEGRDRFFRGYFEKDVWISLRERYLDHAAAETDALAFQISLLLSVADSVPTVNGPASIIAARLRPYVLWKADRAGIPVWPFQFADQAAQDGPAVMRIRAAEEACHDVPCFPRELKHTLSLVGRAPAAVWRTIAVAGAQTGKMVVTEAGRKRAAPLPPEAGRLGDRLLDLFGLTVAEVHLVPEGSSVRVLDILSFPRLAEFEETTGERIAALVADTLLEPRGSD